MRNKITIKKSVKIVNEDGNNCYVIKDKRNSLDNTYNYLLSRSFDYFPDVIESGDKYYKYKYIEDTIEPREQKITDMVNLVTLLHSKTTFYKEVDIDNYISSRVDYSNSFSKASTKLSKETKKYIKQGIEGIFNIFSKMFT